MSGTQTLQFMDGAGGDSEVELLLAGDLQSGNYDFTRICTLDGDGQWGYWDFDSTVVSVALVSQAGAPQRRYFGLGKDGQVFCSESGRHPWTEIIAKAGSGRGKRGALDRIRIIAGKAYACGMGGQVYRRDAEDAWTRLDSTPLSTSKPGAGALSDIGGFAEDDIYVVGDKGRIFHFDGKTWSNVSPNTNLYLESLRCGDDGLVYVAGQGILLAGDKNGWRSLSEPDDIEDIWDLQWFAGSLYVVADDRLMRLDGEDLVPVDTGLVPAPDAHRLSASNGWLWSIGEDDIARFDGTSWVRVVHPENQP